MGFQNQFATAVLPARLDLARPADIVEGARLLCSHIAEIEGRAAVVSSPPLRLAYANYRRTLTTFAYVPARTSALIEAVAALARARGPLGTSDLRRVEGVIAGAVELLATVEAGDSWPPRERAFIRSGLLDLIQNLDDAAAVAILCQGFAEASRDAEIFQFPSSGVLNRGENDA